MSNGKVKGLLKGLKHISQIFENEKEAEMQIGVPTDVKHVAHIGWDGPSANNPSWMNEFSTAPSITSAPFNRSTRANIKDKNDVSTKQAGEDDKESGEKGSNSSPDVRPKSSKHRSSSESPTSHERSERHKARRSSKSKESSDKKQSSRGGEEQNESPNSSLPDIPRHGRRKKTSRSKPHAADAYKSSHSDPGPNSGTESISVSLETTMCQTP